MNDRQALDLIAQTAIPSRFLPEYEDQSDLYDLPAEMIVDAVRTMYNDWRRLFLEYEN